MLRWCSDVRHLTSTDGAVPALQPPRGVPAARLAGRSARTSGNESPPSGRRTPKEYGLRPWRRQSEFRPGSDYGSEGRSRESQGRVRPRRSVSGRVDGHSGRAWRRPWRPGKDRPAEKSEWSRRGLRRPARGWRQLTSRGTAPFPAGRHAEPRRAVGVADTRCWRSRSPRGERRTPVGRGGCTISACALIVRTRADFGGLSPPPTRPSTDASAARNRGGEARPSSLRRRLRRHLIKAMEPPVYPPKTTPTVDKR